VAAVLFYHLSESTVEQTVRSLLSRAVGQGWKVVVRGRAPERLDTLDRTLWLGPEDDFLPHGRAGGPHDASQPVLLTERQDIPAGAAGLMLLDGAAFNAEEAAALERVWVLFEDTDHAVRDVARAQWKLVTESGMAAQYWIEDGGRWQKKMERSAATNAQV
jgi:DNA polymerase III subunit chi